MKRDLALITLNGLVLIFLMAMIRWCPIANERIILSMFVLLGLFMVLLGRLGADQEVLELSPEHWKEIEKSFEVHDAHIQNVDDLDKDNYLYVNEEN